MKTTTSKGKATEFVPKVLPSGLSVRRVDPAEREPVVRPEGLLPVRRLSATEVKEMQGEPRRPAMPAAAFTPVEGDAVRRTRKGGTFRPTEGVPGPKHGRRLATRTRGADEGEWGTGSRSSRRRRRGSRSQPEVEQAMPERIALQGPIVLSDLAAMLQVAPTEIIKRLLVRGVIAAMNQQLTIEQARDVADELGVEVESATTSKGRTVDRGTVGALLADDDPRQLAMRPPVVAVLGHVDHGKTTLLDAIRKARVAQGEAGGITQRIGAYTVSHNDRTLVFLDTPGHEAFAAMRMRGAQVTDVAVLVVAADDGVMPQTLEALSHARAAGVPIVVALNKIDKPNANPDHVLQQLAEHGLVAEAWGGDTIVVPISALKGEGIDALLEMLLLVADIQELKADPSRQAVGTVIEAQIDRGRGPIATVLVQSGTLRIGDTFVAGRVLGRVRAMFDDQGQTVRDAGPSVPVEVLGFDALPTAGDPFQALDDRTARALADSRQEAERRDASQAERAVLLEGDGDLPLDFRVIVKADTQGSLEAVRAAVEKQHNDEVVTLVLHAGVGPINESDVMLAAAMQATVIGFNVRPDAGAEREATRAGVAVKTYRVIYELLDDVVASLTGRLKPKVEVVMLGHAEVRRPIRVPNAGVIAGSYVIDGMMRRGAQARLVRDGVIVYEGRLESLRRFKDDVREVAAGYECGIGLSAFSDVKENDIIECMESREVARSAG